MATTIASYNVAFSLKTAGLVDASKLSRTELAALRQTLGTLETPADKYTKQINSLDTALRKGAITQEHYNRAMKQADGLFSRAATQAGTAKQAFTGLTSTLAGVAATVGLVSLGKQSVQLAMDAETAQIQFEVLLGSAEKATKTIKEMREFAAKSPLSSKDVTDAAKGLVQQGIAGDNLIPTLKRLGDVSLGNSDTFGRLAYVFAQTRSAGRLMGQDLLQYLNAGWNPLNQIAKDLANQFGGIADDYMPKLKAAMSDGLISFDMVNDALKNATSEGGQFANMTERIGETSAGQFAQAVDQLQLLGIEIGTKLLPAVLSLLEGFTQNKTVMQDLVWLTEKWADGFRIVSSIYNDLKDTIVGGGKLIGEYWFGEGNDQALVEAARQFGKGGSFGGTQDTLRNINLEDIKAERDAMTKKIDEAFKPKINEDEKAKADRAKQIQIAEEQKKLQQQQVELMKNLRPNQPIERIR